MVHIVVGSLLDYQVIMVDYEDIVMPSDNH